MTRPHISHHIGLGLAVLAAITIFVFGAPAWTLIVFAWGGAFVYAKLISRYVHHADQRRPGVGSQA